MTPPLFLPLPLPAQHPCDATAMYFAQVKEADIVVSAVGRAEMVKGDWIKPGATVIDVGINSVDDASKKKGYRIDMSFSAKGGGEGRGPDDLP